MKKIVAVFVALTVALAFGGCADDKTKTVTEEKKTSDLSRPAKSGTQEENKPEESVPENNAEETENGEAAKEPEEVKQTESTQVQTPAPATNSNAVPNLAEVRTAMLNECGITDSMMLETDALTRLYSIDAAKVKQSASFVTMSGTFPHEIIMVEAADSAAADAIAVLLQNRLNEVLNQSKSYDAANYALAQQCRIMRNGNFLSLFLSPERVKLEKVYSGYVK